jgi:hypothetical protein
MFRIGDQVLYTGMGHPYLRAVVQNIGRAFPDASGKKYRLRLIDPNPNRYFRDNVLSALPHEIINNPNPVSDEEVQEALQAYVDREPFWWEVTPPGAARTPPPPPPPPPPRRKRTQRRPIMPKNSLLIDDSTEESWKCNICMDHVADVVIKPCLHVICGEDYRKVYAHAHANTRAVCPFCRAAIQGWTPRLRRTKHYGGTRKNKKKQRRASCKKELNISTLSLLK